MLEICQPYGKPSTVEIVILDEFHATSSRPRFGELFWKALGTAMLMLGFAFFRQVAAWFLDGIANTGADVAGIPFVGQRVPQPQPGPTVRPSLWTTPTPAPQANNNTGGIDLSEFR